MPVVTCVAVGKLIVVVCGVVVGVVVVGVGTVVIVVVVGTFVVVVVVRTFVVVVVVGTVVVVVVVATVVVVAGEVFVVNVTVATGAPEEKFRFLQNIIIILCNVLNAIMFLQRFS